MMKFLDRIPRDVAKFLAVGAIAFVVNQALLVATYEYALSGLSRSVDVGVGHLNLALLVCSVIAVEGSIIARFLLNDVWTFADRRHKPFRQRFMHSNLVSLGSPIISVATVNVLTPVFGMNYLIANAIGVVLGLAWNWAGSTRIVWRRAPDPAV